VVLYKVVQKQQAGRDGASTALEQAPRALRRLEVVQLQKLAHLAPVWKLEFSGMGNTLACSLDGRPEVWLWMPRMDGAWAAISRLGAGGGGVGAQEAGDGDGVMVD
jgi:hypothetical protein